METTDCINTRRSVRKFKNLGISNDCIEKIIKAGSMAPSGGNIQPWYFIVIKNHRIIHRLRDEIYKKTLIRYNNNEISHKYLNRIQKYGLLFDAPVIISVCVNLSLYLNTDDMKEPDKILDSIEIISVGACIQNMLLMINELKLSACWCRVHSYYREEIETIIKIERPYYLIANIALGYSDDKPQMPKRKKLSDIHNIIE